MISFCMKRAVEKKAVVRRRLEFVRNKLSDLSVASGNAELDCVSNPEDYDRFFRVYDSRIEKLKEKQRIYDGFLGFKSQ